MVTTLHKEFVENEEREVYTCPVSILSSSPMTSAVTRHNPISSGITLNYPWSYLPFFLLPTDPFGKKSIISISSMSENKEVRKCNLLELLWGQKNWFTHHLKDFARSAGKRSKSVRETFSVQLFNLEAMFWAAILKTVFSFRRVKWTNKDILPDFRY